MFALGSEVAVYKWTLGCDGDSRKQLGDGGSRGETVVVTDDSAIKASFSISAFPQLPTLPQLLVPGFCP